MMSLPIGLFTQVSGSGPLGPLVLLLLSSLFNQTNKCMESYSSIQTIWISCLNKQNSPIVDKAVGR